MFSCGDNNELLSWFCVVPQQLQWSIHLKWKRLHYSPLPVYLVCDWPRPGSCGCECERPPSPGQCESPESDNGRNAASADATDRWQTAQTPPLWSLPPPREKSEGQKHGDGFGLTSQRRAALLSFHWTTTHRSLCALQWPLTSAERCKQGQHNVHTRVQRESASDLFVLLSSALWAPSTPRLSAAPPDLLIMF